MSSAANNESAIPDGTDVTYGGHRHVCSDPKCHVNDYIILLGATEGDVVRTIRDDLNKQIELLDAVREGIAPTIEALQSSPIFKMLGVSSNV